VAGVPVTSTPKMAPFLCIGAYNSPTTRKHVKGGVKSLFTNVPTDADFIINRVQKYIIF
jgi:hypothetical protein